MHFVLFVAQGYCVVCRYILHLLELSNWFSVTIARVKEQQAQDPVHMTCPLRDRTVPETQSYVYSKEDAHCLVLAMTRITTSPAYKQFLAGAGGNASDMEALRLALLGQLTTSLVQNNADTHANRVFLDRVSVSYSHD